FKKAERYHGAAVAVAHNADDQVETFLLHLLRGTGTNGLRGMKSYALPNPWSSQIPLIRPLLGFWRSEILDYLASKEIHPFWDQSNWDNQYTRNRIRNQLIPTLEEYNPAIRKLIWQTCAIVDSDLDFVEQFEKKIWEKVKIQEDTYMLELNLSELRKQPLTLQRRIVRRAWLKFAPKPESVDFEHIQRLINWLNETPTGKWELSPDLTWFNESTSALIIRKGYEQKKSPYPQLINQNAVKISIPGITHLDGDWLLRAEVITDWKDQPWRRSGGDTRWDAWIDLERCILPLFIRTPQEGDRMDPYGMHGAQAKVSDIFINRKIPQRFRQSFPLIWDSERIIWLPSYTIVNAVKVTETTKVILHLMMERNLE
ncbi:MAG: tRNA lysidine(34) synthetase TilS, partial [Anaerolineales bacterium]